MDVGVITAVAMLVVWAVVALGYNGPGWIHLLLTGGVTLLIYRIVARGTRQTDSGARAAKSRGDSGHAE
jgi:uncharacterized membrane protein